MSAGKLFVVATPIGNLEDITLRALRVLRAAGLIAAEDTRRTARLLAHHGIATPTISFHEHNVRQRIPELIDRLRSGLSIALVTDAGTPGVSDPGSELVTASLAADIRVEPIPGASAPLAAALASGFPMIPLTILGFPPHGLSARNAWFEHLASVPHTATFFESPHKIRRTLDAASQILGDRPIMVARELTKIHEQYLFGDSKTVLAALGEPRGEFTVVVGPRKEPALTRPETASDEQVIDEFGRMADSGLMSRRQAVSIVAAKFGKSPNEVYAALERSKKSDL